MPQMEGFKTEEIHVPNYERVVYCESARTGLKAIIAVHNTNLGPSCGGIRLLPYASKEEALQDVLRLSKGMSYKSALAGIGFGGGKSVILCDPKGKSPELFQEFGRFVDSFQGKYIAAKDMNIESADLIEVRKATKYVLGIEGVAGSSGDPSPVTARGAFQAFRATVDELGADSFAGLRVAIQGVGHVGYGICELLHKAGAQLIVSDISQESCERAKQNFGARVSLGDKILDEPCDIFSPNARGGVLNQESIPRLKCRAIVGAANNQLLTPQDGMRLHERGILYAPDFAVNAGGIINIFVEVGGYDQAKAFQMTDQIYHTMKEIFSRAKKTKQPPFVVADQLAEERIYGRK